MNRASAVPRICPGKFSRRDVVCRAVTGRRSRWLAVVALLAACSGGSSGTEHVLSKATVAEATPGKTVIDVATLMGCKASLSEIDCPNCAEIDASGSRLVKASAASVRELQCFGPAKDSSATVTVTFSFSQDRLIDTESDGELAR